MLYMYMLGWWYSPLHFLKVLQLLFDVKLLPTPNLMLMCVIVLLCLYLCRDKNKPFVG